MLVTIAVVAAFAARNHRLGYDWLNSVPRAYRLALLGIPIFVLGGLGRPDLAPRLGHRGRRRRAPEPDASNPGFGDFLFVQRTDSLGSGRPHRDDADPSIAAGARFGNVAHPGALRHRLRVRSGGGPNQRAAAHRPVYAGLSHRTRDRLLQGRQRRADRYLPEHADHRLFALVRRAREAVLRRADDFSAGRQPSGGGRLHQPGAAAGRYDRASVGDRIAGRLVCMAI